jgi:hypothetical protein
MCISSGCQVGKKIVIFGNAHFRITSCNISEKMISTSTVSQMTTTNSNLLSNSSITSFPHNSNWYLTLFLLYLLLAVIVVILAIVVTVGICLRIKRKRKFGKCNFLKFKKYKYHFSFDSVALI